MDKIKKSGLEATLFYYREFLFHFFYYLAARLRMKRSNENRKSVIYFSQWSRKGYAVFAALGKEVAVATVPINVCKQALLKSAKKGVVVQELDYAKENVLQEGVMRQIVGIGCRMQAGMVCADANGMNLKMNV